MSKKQHCPPRDPFVFIVIHLRESRRNQPVNKAQQSGQTFQQWALAIMENA